MSVDAAAGGALMGKSIDAAKALLEEMASNNYHWSSERATPKRASGVYGVDAVDMLASKVDALAQRFDRLGTPSSGSHAGSSSGAMFEVGALCEICGIQGHVATECQSTFQGVEQANVMQNFNPRPQNNPYSNTYNPGWRNHPNFSYRNNNPIPPNASQPQPPGFQQRAPYNPPLHQQPSQPKSNLESLMEQFIATQTKTNETLSASINQLNSKFDAVASHQKAMDTQIAQQVNHLSRPPGHLPGQPETNPKGQMNVITLRSGKELESPQVPRRDDRSEADSVGDFEKEVPTETPRERAPIEKTTDAQVENVAPPLQPYKPPVPYPQRLVKAKEEHKYGKFLEMLKKFHINIPFLEAITDMPSYAKFLKDLLSNKGKLLENATVSLTEECSAIIQNKLPPKLSDPGSFSIPCSVGDVTIRKALCDLGPSVSLMPFSICKKLQMGDLKPTTISLQLADRSVKYPWEFWRMSHYKWANSLSHVTLWLWRWKRTPASLSSWGGPF